MVIVSLVHNAGPLHCYRAEPEGNVVDWEPVTAALIRLSRAKPDQRFEFTHVYEAAAKYTLS